MVPSNKAKRKFRPLKRYLEKAKAAIEQTMTANTVLVTEMMTEFTKFRHIESAL